MTIGYVPHSSGGGEFGEGWIGGVVLLLSIIGTILGSWLFMLAAPVGIGLILDAALHSAPLTDAQKRAFGAHLPPHLQSVQPAQPHANSQRRSPRS